MDITWKKVSVKIGDKTVTYLVPDFGAARNKIRKKAKKDDNR